jgi:hypothetical protein
MTQPQLMRRQLSPTMLPARPGRQAFPTRTISNYPTKSDFTFPNFESIDDAQYRKIDNTAIMVRPQRSQTRCELN